VNPDHNFKVIFKSNNYDHITDIIEMVMLTSALGALVEEPKKEIFA
jgi:hypothetical protein